MPKDSSLSDKGCNFSQTGNTCNFVTVFFLNTIDVGLLWIITSNAISVPKIIEFIKRYVVKSQLRFYTIVWRNMFRELLFHSFEQTHGTNLAVNIRDIYYSESVYLFSIYDTMITIYDSKVSVYHESIYDTMIFDYSSIHWTNARYKSCCKHSRYLLSWKCLSSIYDTMITIYVSKVSIYHESIYDTMIFNYSSIHDKRMVQILLQKFEKMYYY